MEKAVKLIKLSATPISIFYPLPIVPAVVFSLASAGKDLFTLLKMISLTFTFFAAINLWNHINDVQEDLLSNRQNVFSENEDLRKIGVLLVLGLYFLSFYFVWIWSLDKLAFRFFIVVALLTWIYSDKFIFGKYLIRFKDYYMTEIFTYALAYPFFIFTLWSLASKLNYKAYVLATLLLFFGLYGLFLKDIKDITGDEQAGLNTLAVKFEPSALFKFSLLFLFIFYSLIAVFSLLGLLPTLSFVIFFFIVIPIYVIKVLYKNQWKFTLDLSNLLNLMTTLNVMSLVLLALIATFKL